MIKIIVIAHNIRSVHNVGSLLRTAEGLGIDKVILTGYSPYPTIKNDPRLPHLALKMTNQIAKTALGAEKTKIWNYQENIIEVINKLKKQKFVIAGLEQNHKSIKLNSYKPKSNISIILGSEVTGIDHEILKLCDLILEIPMFGKKESFNVVEAATMTMYHLKFLNN